MKEIWKDIEGYEGLYQVSNLGRIKSFHKKNEIVMKLNYARYTQIDLMKDGERKCKRVCRLVGIHFISNPENKPQINHKDGNKHNNVYTNLEWATGSENCVHAFENNLRARYPGEKHGMAKATDKIILEIRKKYDSGKYTKSMLAKEYGFFHSHICQIINRKIWKHI